MPQLTPGHSAVSTAWNSSRDYARPGAARTAAARHEGGDVVCAAAAGSSSNGAGCVSRGDRLGGATDGLRLARRRSERRRACVPVRRLVTACAAATRRRSSRRVRGHDRRLLPNRGLRQQRTPDRQNEAAPGGVRGASFCLLRPAFSAKRDPVRPCGWVRGAHGVVSAVGPNWTLLRAQRASSAVRIPPPARALRT